MESDPGYRFLCGEDMDPTAVRLAYPGARFVARARLGEPEAGIAAPIEVWGILIRVDADAGEEGPSRQVVADDGGRFQARLAGEGRPRGAAAAVLAAARYWELPPAYVGHLAAEVGDDPA